MRRRTTTLALAASVVAAGCGNEQTPPPNIGRIPAPAGFRDAKYLEQGVLLRAPTNWRISDGDAPQIATVAVGDAQIAIWRYPRSEPLPETREQLKAARKALVAQVEARDSTFRLTSSRLVVKEGLRGVELVGSVTNQGRPRSVRSLHAYGQGAEVVVDAFAPPRDFPRVDEETFGPVARSLKLRKPRSS
ncbi:MAG TPA: hypothetical protein VMY78_15160 [Solirubrobacteraceae bacterium]|nr:hypothetical protein [Solirubrobacteraceae bacterium]